MNIALKTCFVISLCLFFAVPCFPDTEEPGSGNLFSLSAEAIFGVLYGEGQEIVYKDAKGNYLSELLWDMKPLFYVGATLSLKLRPSWPVGFYTTLSAKSGIPGPSGDTEDRDWLDSDHDYLTHYSKHDNYTNSALFLDGDLGISIPLRPGKSFNPAVSVFGRVSYMKLEWSSRDGYTQYGPNGTMLPPFDEWEDSFPKKESSGPAIQYSQTWFFISPGLAADFPVSRFLSLSCSFTITPFLWAVAEDEHKNTAKQVRYKDYPQGGLGMEPKAWAVFFPASRFSLSLQASYRYISGSKGDTWRKTPNSPYIQDGTGGAGFHALDAGISVKVNF
jgi:outer membrane protease